jgi:2-polyprenyl-3-methyl-5-hydroxy-6-metoxy-1,4-benzoquinol methylase
MGERAVPRFGFGANFLDYHATQFDESRLEYSRRAMLGFLGLDDLAGKRMIDIGCGPGITSLVAYRAHIAELFSFDYDPNSVTATRRMHALAGSPSNWRIDQGSVIDTDYMDKLGQFDIVYCWGVLHHTGDMWTGVRNAANRVAPGGLLYIAIYNTDYYKLPSPEFWLTVKRLYNKGGALRKRAIEVAYVVADVVWKLLRGRHPTAHMRAYKERRGMNYFVAVRDWVGGWPMEYATAEEVRRFITGLGLGLELVKVNPASSCAEYLFKRPA